ncbi:MAG TPA: RNA-binding S4 domain-containing protein [Acidimicrobiales bacterium]|nr:RNA-binding S4 domain-containing protein [Acidimicrobiales bacterium]
MSSTEAAPSARVDKWLWAVRMFKTRTEATDACRAGHVRVNGTSAKPSTTVKPADHVEALTPGGPRVLEVAGIIEKRVGAPLASACYIDHTPPAPPKEEGVANFERERGAGRPTKRDRRQLDRARHPGS